MINFFLRNDDARASKYLAVVVRGINTLLITGRTHKAMVRFPPGGTVYRGGGLPDDHRMFYKPGKKYRVPGFLASSFSRTVAENFMVFADARDEPCVLWIIHVDPAGEHDVTKRCLHVNYVTHTNVHGEGEYLFAPYAPFEVKSVGTQ
jgi:hypothetical protein